MPEATDIGALVVGIEALMRADPDMADVTIERAEPVNDDPRHCPWVGLYRGAMRLEPRTVGLGQGAMRENTDLLLICQEAHLESGAECQVLLDRLVKKALGFLLNHTTAAGRVDSTLGIDVTYEYDRSEEAFMQSAIVAVRFQSKTTL